MYKLELPKQTGTQYFAVFHKAGCSFIGTYGTLQPYEVTKSEAISTYGAFACPNCFDYYESVPILP